MSTATSPYILFWVITERTSWILVLVNLFRNSLARSMSMIEQRLMPLHQRLVVRRRPSRTPLTASLVYVCIYFCRPHPAWEAGTRLQLFFHLRIWNNFAVNSIFIDYRSTDGFRVFWASDSCLPHRIIPVKPVSGDPGVLVAQQPWSPGGKWTPDSSSPRRVTPESFQTYQS